MQSDIQERSIFRIANLLARRLIGRSALTLATECEDYCLVDAAKAVGISESTLTDLPPNALQLRTDLVQQYFITVEGFCHNLGSDGGPYNTNDWWDKVNYINRERTVGVSTKLQSSSSTLHPSHGHGTLILGRDITPAVFFAHYRPAGGSWSLLSTQLRLMDNYTVPKSKDSSAAVASASSSISGAEPETKRTRTLHTNTSSSSSESVYSFPTTLLPSSIDEYLRTYGTSDSQITALIHAVIKHSSQKKEKLGGTTDGSSSSGSSGSSSTGSTTTTTTTSNTPVVPMNIDNLFPSLINNRRYKEEFSKYLSDIQNTNTTTTTNTDLLNRLILSYYYLGNAQVPLCNQIYPKLPLPSSSLKTSSTTPYLSTNGGLPSSSTTTTASNPDEKLLLPVSSFPLSSSNKNGPSNGTNTTDSTVGASKPYTGRPRGRPRVYPNGFAAARANMKSTKVVTKTATVTTIGSNPGTTESAPAFGSIFGSTTNPTGMIGGQPGTSSFRGRPPRGRPRGRPFNRPMLVRPPGVPTNNPSFTGTGSHGSNTSVSLMSSSSSSTVAANNSSSTTTSIRVQEILNRYQQQSSTLSSSSAASLPPNSSTVSAYPTVSVSTVNEPLTFFGSTVPTTGDQIQDDEENDGNELVYDEEEEEGDDEHGDEGYYVEGDQEEGEADYAEENEDDEGGEGEGSHSYPMVTDEEGNPINDREEYPQPEDDGGIEEMYTNDTHPGDGGNGDHEMMQ